MYDPLAEHMIKMGSVVEFLDITHGSNGWIHAHSVGVVRTVRELAGHCAYSVSVLANEAGGRTDNWAVDVEESHLDVLASGAAPTERPYYRIPFQRIRSCWVCRCRFIVAGSEIVEEEPLTRWFTVEVHCPYCGARHEEVGSFSGAIEVQRA